MGLVRATDDSCNNALPGRGRGFSATVYFTASHTVIADSTRIAIRNATSG